VSPNSMADDPPTDEAPVQAAEHEPAAECSGDAEAGMQDTAGEEGGEEAAQNGAEHTATDDNEGGGDEGGGEDPAGGEADG